MKLCCSIPEENWDIFIFLEKKKLKPKLLKGRIEVEFQEEFSDEQGDYYIEDFPTNAYFFLKLYESGGGKTNTGFGQIICGNRGNKLIPNKIYTTGHLSNNIHAEFYTREAMIITSTKHGMIKIVNVYVYIRRKNKKFLFVRNSKLNVWNGEIEELPFKFYKYKRAIKAAYNKANCYHCRKPFYIKTSNNY